MEELSLEYNPEAGTLAVLDVCELPIYILSEDMEQVDFNSMTEDERMQYIFDNYPGINEDIVDAIDSHRY